MKKYLEALQKYENNNNSFELLCNFIAVKNSNLIKLYCNGKMHLPSFILLKNLRLKFTDLVNEDEELKILFSNAIKCSKLFYSQTINTIKTTNNSEHNFEDLFTEQSQPLGQRLINLLVNIKYRVRIARLKRQTNKKIGSISLINTCLNKLTPAIHSMHDYVYKIRLLQSTHNSLSRKIYYLIVTLTLTSFWLINSPLTSELSAIPTTIINLIFCAIITLLAMLTYPVCHFGLIDIDGKNIVAYKYQIFFNNLSNQKMYKIFTLQQTDGTGHTDNAAIESPQCQSV